MSTNDLQQALQRGTADRLITTITRVRGIAGDLPVDIEQALTAVRLAEVSAVHSAVTAPTAHRAAVDGLKATARTTGTLDPTKAAKTLTAARAVDLAATTAADLAETAFTELVRELSDISRRHGEAILGMIRPRTMAAYAALDEAVTQLPIGVQISRPLDYGGAVASLLAAIASHIDTIVESFDVRRQLIADSVLPPLTVDRGGHFTLICDPWKHERGMVIAGNGRVAGLGRPLIDSVLPPPGLARWVHLSRVGATWWFPSPAQQDNACRAYLDARNTDSVVGEYDETQLTIVSAGRNW